MEIEKVIEKLSTIISHENQSYLRSLLPKYLPAIEFLYGLKIARKVSGLTFTFQNEKGDHEDWFVNSYPFHEYVEQLQSNRIHIAEDKLPLYRKNSGQNYWMEYIDEAKTLYFNYHTCREMTGESVDDFGKRLMNFIDTSTAEKYWNLN